MPLQVSQPPELEDRLRKEAERQGLLLDAVTRQMLEQHLPPADRRTAALAMLQQWAAEDAALTEEEAAANEAVLRALDEDRLSERKLFANILKAEST